jgi:hypothetical protein
MPLFFFQLYLGFSILLYAFGPWPWDTPNQPLTIGYLVVVQLFIAIGYLFSWSKVCQTRRLTGQNTHQYNHSAVIFIKVALFVNYLLFIPSSLSRTGIFFPDLILGLTNTGLAYNINLQRLDQGNPYVLFEYLRMVASPWIIGLFPISVVYWKQISSSLRFLCFGAIFLNVSLYIGTGTNKGLADFVISLPWLIALGASVGYLRVRFNPKIFIIFGFLIVAFLAFFSASQIQRSGDAGVAGAFDSGNGIISANRDHWVSTHLPEILVIIFESISRYVTQGYYALSLTFDLDSQTTYGFGNSMFLARNADLVTASNYFTTHSLPSLLEQSNGWSMTGLWHSIYPWLASDFGFVGTLVVIGILSYLMGLSWGLALVVPRPITIIMFYLLLIIFYYIPANNQILQSGETAVAFFLCLFAFIVSRKKISLINSFKV